MSVLSGHTSSSTQATEFDRWWNSQGAWVEPENIRRGGQSGVQLLSFRDPSRTPLYCKRQTGHTYRSLLHPFGRPTVLREQHAYRAFAKIGIKTPRLIYCAARQRQGQWQALLITEALRGFVSLEHWWSRSRDSSENNIVLKELGRTLALLHLARWQHGCCYPKHIFVRVGDNSDVEIALLDLEKSRRRLRPMDAARHDLGQLMRHRGNISHEELKVVSFAHQQVLGVS